MPTSQQAREGFTVVGQAWRVARQAISLVVVLLRVSWGSSQISSATDADADAALQSTVSRTSAFTLGVMWLDQGNQPLPRLHLIHLGTIPSGLAYVTYRFCVLACCKANLKIYVEYLASCDRLIIDACKVIAASAIGCSRPIVFG